VLASGGLEGDTGWWPALVFDAEDRPHISFCDAAAGDLQYATKVQGQWQVEPAVSEGAVGKYTALALDSKGGVGISFYDQDQKYLRYAFRSAPGAPWQTERIAWGLEVGMASELRFDAAGVAHLFYYVPSGRLVHASRGSAGWDKTVVREAVGSYSVRIDVQARPEGFWLSFVNWNFTAAELWVAAPDSTAVHGVRLETVDQQRSPGWRSQLYFDQSGQPAVLYSVGMDLKLARRTTGLWQSGLVMQGVGNFAAARSHSGSVFMAYEDVARGNSGTGVIRLAQLDEAGKVLRHWALDSEGPTGQYLDIALDSKGSPMVAYYSGEIRGLKVYEN
jgi:hypothetical protein